MKIYLRERETGAFYSAEPIADASRRPDITIFWKLKKIGEDSEQNCSTREISTKFEPCSPYEALSINCI